MNAKALWLTWIGLNVFSRFSPTRKRNGGAWPLSEKHFHSQLSFRVLADH
jgi:hypothetical protein